MKIYLTIFLSLLLPVSVLAADLSLDTDTVISVSGISLNVSGSTASVDSMTVDASSFTLTLSGGQSIQITSSDRRFLTVSQLGSLAITSACSSSNAITTITNPSAGVQVTPTISPQASACIVDGGGGGGGGGGSGIAPVIPSQNGVAAVSTPVAVVTAPTIPAAAVATPSPVAVAVSPVFSKILKLGAINLDVKRLQQLLNSDPDTKIAALGVGSSGHETERFGSLTEKALQKFQVKYGLVSSGTPTTTGYGVLGPKTRAKIQEVFGGKTVSSVVPVTTPAAVPATPAPVSTPAPAATYNFNWMNLTPAPSPR